MSSTAHDLMLPADWQQLWMQVAATHLEQYLSSQGLASNAVLTAVAASSTAADVVPF